MVNLGASTPSPLSLLSWCCRGGMEVTRGNFRAVLPEMEAAIRDSIFVAIDGEFTGLSTDR